MASIELNKEAPEFEIYDFKGNKIKISNFRKMKNVLVVFNRGFA